jgi:hypothetical protein
MSSTVKDWKTTIPGIAGIILGLLNAPGVAEFVNVNPTTAHIGGIVAAVAMGIQLIFGAISAKKSQ